jgi:general stress protein YciG
MAPGEREEIGRLGGLARSKNLSKEELSEIGKKAGKAGGRARAQSLTKEQRKEIGRKAAAARWGKRKQN